MSTQNEKPVIFNSEMVRAILNGRKSQTRRIAKIQDRDYSNWGKEAIDAVIRGHCPYGKVGDRLWVKETYCICDNRGSLGPCYKTSLDTSKLLACDGMRKWKSSRFMFKKYVRIWLEITGIKVENVQEIDAVEAEAEGMRRPKRLCPDRHDEYILGRFIKLWDSLNTKQDYSWDKNPWVWVVEFKRV